MSEQKANSSQEIPSNPPSPDVAALERPPSRAQAWLKFFPPERFLLLQSEDLRVETRRQAMLDEVHDFLKLPPHTYPAEDLAELGNFRKFTNTSVSPALRSIEALLDAPPGAFDWCARARADLPDAGDVRLASSRPPMPRPSPMPTPKPRKKKRRSWWRGAGPDI